MNCAASVRPSVCLSVPLCPPSSPPMAHEGHHHSKSTLTTTAVPYKIQMLKYYIMHR